MNNKLVGGAVGLAVAIIVIASVLAPTLTDADHSMKQYTYFENDTEEYFVNLSEISDKTSNTLTASDSGIVTNHGTIPLWAEDYNAIILYTKDLIAITSNDGSTLVYTSAGGTNCSTFTAVVSAGEITYSLDQTTSVTIPYSEGYVVDPKGQFVSIPNSVTPKYLDNEKFAGYRFDSGLYCYINGQGYKNGAESAMTVSKGEVADTEGQVSTLTGVNYTTSKALTGNWILENKAEYGKEIIPGASSMIMVILPIMLIGVVLAAIPIMRRD